MTAVLDDLGLFTVEEVRKIQPVPPRLEDAPMRALAPADSEPGWARVDAFTAWKTRYGNFNCVFRCHGWVPAYGPKGPDHDHMLIEFNRNLGCEGHRGVSCSCVGGRLRMVACRCGWESTPDDDVSQGAVLAGLDHTHPGWRTMPVIDARFPDHDAKAQPRWFAAAVEAGYPADWFDRGGPVLTAREGAGTRHVPYRLPGGGYDVGCVNGVPA